MITNPNLHHLAENLGVTLRRHDRGPKGWYSDSYRVISTRRRLPIAQYRSTLAHELGHAIRGDETYHHTHFDQRCEQKANEIAADLLIDEKSFRDAYQWHQGNMPAIAQELEIAPNLLHIWITKQRKAA